MTQKEFSVVRDILRVSNDCALEWCYVSKITSFGFEGNTIDIDEPMFKWQFDTFADYICSQILDMTLAENGIEVED